MNRGLKQISITALIICLMIFTLPYHANAALAFISAEVLGSSANTSTLSATVPPTTKFALIYWSGYRSGSNMSMNTISLGGMAGTILQNGAMNTPTTDFTARGVAIVLAPPTGSQTLAWDWTGAQAMTEGSPFVVSYFDSTSAPVIYTDVVVDSDITAWTGDTSGSVTLDSITGGYVQGVVQSFDASTHPSGAPGGSGQTVDLNDNVFNQEGVDVAHENTPGASATTFSGSGDYGSIVAVSLKDYSSSGTNHSPKVAVYAPIILNSPLIIQ